MVANIVHEFEQPVKEGERMSRHVIGAGSEESSSTRVKTAISLKLATGSDVLSC